MGEGCTVSFSRAETPRIEVREAAGALHVDHRRLRLGLRGALRALPPTLRAAAAISAGRGSRAGHVPDTCRTRAGQVPRVSF